MLLVVAAVMHVTIAMALFAAGRAQLAPRLIDRDGLVAAPFSDSYEYQHDAVWLTNVLRARGVAEWARRSAPAHVRMLSLAFAVLGPVVGHGILAAEPINLACYVAIVALVLAIGREVGGPRAGLAAAVVVMLWPTFLVSTMQFLKDPPFIAAMLALVLVVTTWLTRAYRWSDAVVAGVAVMLAAALLLTVRARFLPVVVALALFGAALLVARQIAERRVLRWNCACALSVIVVGSVPFARGGRTIEKVAAYPSRETGQPKSSVGSDVALRASVVWRRAEGATPNGAPEAPNGGAARAHRLRQLVDRAAWSLGDVRRRFNVDNLGAGSAIDGAVELSTAGDLLRYLPRAMQIGLWAPFPSMWLGVGTHVGRSGRLLSGVETLAIYLCQALALVAIVRAPRRLAALLLFGVTAFGLTVMGLVVTNVGTLYRFRYGFWVLLVILGMAGLETLVQRRSAA